MAGDDSQRLTVKAQAQGFDQAAKEIGKVTGAQEKLKAKVAGQAKGTERAAQAQDKLNASNEDYISLLGRIDPRLGALADAMFKGSKAAGDLANTQLNLRSVLSTTSDAIKAQANTLKLLAAGGAVYAGITAAVSAYRQMRSDASAGRFVRGCGGNGFGV